MGCLKKKNVAAVLALVLCAAAVSTGMDSTNIQRQGITSRSVEGKLDFAQESEHEGALRAITSIPIMGEVQVDEKPKKAQHDTRLRRTTEIVSQDQISSVSNLAASHICSGAKVINDRSRLVSNGNSAAQCDSSLTAGWYKFPGYEIPMKTTPQNRCGTHATGWVNLGGAALPGPDTEISAKVCFNWGNSACNWQAAIKIRNCASFLAYYLNPTAHCSLRYCLEVAQTQSPSRSPSQSPTVECRSKSKTYLIGHSTGEIAPLFWLTRSLKSSNGLYMLTNSKINNSESIDVGRSESQFTFMMDFLVLSVPQYPIELLGKGAGFSVMLQAKANSIEFGVGSCHFLLQTSSSKGLQGLFALEFGKSGYSAYVDGTQIGTPCSLSTQSNETSNNNLMQVLPLSSTVLKWNNMMFFDGVAKLSLVAMKSMAQVIASVKPSLVQDIASVTTRANQLDLAKEPLMKAFCVNPNGDRNLYLFPSGCGSGVYSFHPLVGQPKPDERESVFKVSVDIDYIPVSTRRPNRQDVIGLELGLMDDTISGGRRYQWVGRAAIAGPFLQMHSGRHFECLTSDVRTLRVEATVFPRLNHTGPLILIVRSTLSRLGIHMALVSIRWKLFSQQSNLNFGWIPPQNHVVIFRGPPMTQGGEVMMCPKGFFVDEVNSLMWTSSMGKRKAPLKLTCRAPSGASKTMWSSQANSTGVTKAALTCPKPMTLQGVAMMRVGPYPNQELGLRISCADDYGFAKFVSSPNPSNFSSIEQSPDTCPPGLRLCGVYFYRHPVYLVPYAFGNICCSFLKYARRSDLMQQLSIYSTAQAQCPTGKFVRQIDTTEKLQLVVTMGDYLRKDVVIGAPGAQFVESKGSFLAANASLGKLMTCQVSYDVARGERNALHQSVADKYLLFYRYESKSFDVAAQAPSGSVRACYTSKQGFYNGNTTEATYVDAKQMCVRKFDRDMLKISSVGSLLMAKKLCSEIPGVTQCWLGLRFHAATDRWLWDDGTPMVFHNFDLAMKQTSGSGSSQQASKMQVPVVKYQQLEPSKFKDGQCAVMSNTDQGFWRAVACTGLKQTGLVCGQHAHVTSHGDITKSTSQLSCVPNLNKYLKSEPLNLYFESCPMFKFGLEASLLLPYVSISLAMKNGLFFTMFVDAKSGRPVNKWGSNWWAYPISENVDLLKLRNSLAETVLIELEAMDKMSTTKFICFLRAKLELFHRVFDLPASGKPAVRGIQRYGLGVKCTGDFVQVANGLNEVVLCSDRLSFNPRNATTKFFEIRVRSCPIASNALDGHTLKKMSVDLLGARTGTTQIGKTAVEFVKLPPVPFGMIGSNTLWRSGLTYQMYYHMNVGTSDFIGTVGLKYTSGIHQLNVGYQFCASQPRSDIESEIKGTQVIVGARASFSELRWEQPQTYLVVYGTYDRRGERRVLDLKGGVSGEFEFMENIGRVEGIGFETVKSKESAGAYAKVCKLWVQYIGTAKTTTKLIDISYILGGGEFGDFGWYDRQTNRFVSRWNFDLNDPLISVVSQQLGTFCVADVSVQDSNGKQRFGRMFENQIGSCPKCSPVATAYIAYPICGVRVMNCRWRNGPKEVPNPNSPGVDSQTTIVQTCTNKQRFIYSECSVNRMISHTFVSTNVTHELFSKSESSDEADGTDKDDGGSDTSLEGGAAVGLGPTWEHFGITAEGHFSHTTDTSTGFEIEKKMKTSSNSKSSMNDKSLIRTDSETIDISCSGSIMVPPFHSIDYQLQLTKSKMITWEFVCDHELILCSSGVSANQYSTNPVMKNIHVRYASYKVPACAVVFQEKTTINLNHLTCNKEQELAWYSGSIFVPACVQGASTQYEPCQCIPSTSSAAGVCACFKTSGDIDGNKGVMTIPSGKNGPQTCQMLGCGSMKAALKNDSMRLDVEEGAHGYVKDNSMFVKRMRVGESMEISLIGTIAVVVGVCTVVGLVAFVRQQKRSAVSDDEAYLRI